MKGENKVEPVKAYACYLKDDNKRMNSSSGAVTGHGKLDDPVCRQVSGYPL